MSRYSTHDEQMPFDVTDAEAYDYEDGMTTAAADLAAEQAEAEQDHWEAEADYRALYGYEDDAVSQGMYDDDPSPYAGDYSEM